MKLKKILSFATIMVASPMAALTIFCILDSIGINAGASLFITCTTFPIIMMGLLYRIQML